MDYLEGLAEYFGDRHHHYGFPAHLIPGTFQKVRRLLRHEVNFKREQKTLMEARELYRSFSGVAIPQVIQPLCTSTLTALTEEKGIKVTNAAARLPASRRRQISEQLVEALIAVPLLSAKREAIFHGDPHAGNLLFDRRSGRIVILDWALRERFGREQRRHLALLFLMLSLRDPVGVSNEIVELSQRRIRSNSREWRTLQETVDRFLDAMPASNLPSAADAMRLLESVAMKGINFPGSLIILSKVMFTLEGVLNDISGTDHEMGFAIARQVARRWITNRGEYESPLIAQDWSRCNAARFCC
jgi:ubiquinone biosynthesis protein